MIEQQQASKVISKDQWACRPLSEKYTLSKQIGQGAYGSVYEAHRLQDNKKLALKKMQNFQQKQQKQGKAPFGFPITTLRQIKLLQHLQHDNILNINDVVFQKPHRHTHKSHIIYLCLDLMDSDLGYLVNNKQYKFTTFRIQQITKQILQGLNYLHHKNVAHRDLKPANILINTQGIVKVADFGLAKKLAKFSTTLVVTMWYRAPELFFGMKTYSTNIDIWSLGCVLAEFLLGKPLFGHCRSEKQEIQAIYDIAGTPDECQWDEVEKYDQYETLKPSQSKSTSIVLFLKKNVPEFAEQNLLLDLIQKMLRLNPNSRLSASECLSHEFFQTKYEQEPLLPEFIKEKKQKTDQGKDYVQKRVKQN